MLNSIAAKSKKPVNLIYRLFALFFNALIEINVLSKHAFRLFYCFFKVDTFAQYAFKQVAGFLQAVNGIEYGKVLHG